MSNLHVLLSKLDFTYAGLAEVKKAVDAGDNFYALKVLNSDSSVCRRRGLYLTGCSQVNYGRQRNRTDRHDNLLPSILTHK